MNGMIDIPYKSMYFQLLFKNKREEAIMGNTNMEPSDRLILIMLERYYPQAMHTLVPIQAWKLAQLAGCRRETVSKFLRAMRDQGYIHYKQEKKSIIRDGKVLFESSISVQELSACQEPGQLHTRNTQRRERKREHDRKRCRSCGEQVKSVTYQQCVSCGEVQ